MTAKFSTARCERFLAALAETGNQTLACERARVSRSWVSLHRSTDPAFRERLEAATAQAKARLLTAAAVEPASGWRTLDGEELAVRGSNGRRTQIARARLRQWTPRVEQRFLDALAGCCNVKRACAAVGLSVAGAYGHRRRWPEFGRRWDQALAMGYERLEGAAVAQAGNMFDPEGRPDEEDIEPAMLSGPVTMADAIKLLQIHRYRVHGVGKPLRRPRPRTLDEVRGSILKKLDAIVAAQRHEARLAGLDPDACVHCGGTGRIEA